MCLSIHQITLLIAIYTVVQGLAVLSLNIVFVLVGTGSLTDTTNSFILHASIYLNCPISGSNSTWSCSQYPPLNQDAVFGYEITYVVLHCLWLAGAVVLLTQLCKKKGWPDYILWLIACSLLIILDTVTGAFYIVDTTKEKDDALNAAVMMTLISFRGVAFYVLNIVCLALVSYALRDTLSTRHQHQSKNTRATTAAATELTERQNSPSSNGGVTPGTVVPIARPEVERAATPKADDSKLDTDENKPVFLGYQADPALVARNQEVVSQIQQGHGSGMYNPEAYAQPYTGRSSYTREFQEDDRDYNLYPGNEGAIPRVAPAYRTSQREPNMGPGYSSLYAYENSMPVHDDYPEEYYHDDASGLPRVPPRAPARVKRNTSSRHARPMPPNSPPVPPQDYEKKVPPPVPPKKAPYDVRPFSYVNPSFRPADHGDVNAMKAHPADIKKTLVEDLEQLKLKEEQAEGDSDGPSYADHTPVSAPKHDHKANDRSDAGGQRHDAPRSNNSHTEGRADQHDSEPAEYYQELMTTV